MSLPSRLCTVRYRYVVPVLSLLPDAVTMRLNRRWPLCYDPTDGWTLWLDASYTRWCRHDARKSKPCR